MRLSCPCCSRFSFNCTWVIRTYCNLYTDIEMMEKTAEELAAWKTDMKIYEKNKRTKKPFGQGVPKVATVTHADVKNREVLFNPLLQTYKHQEDELRWVGKEEHSRAKSLMNHLSQHRKYERNYDIVNLYGSEEKVQQSPPKKLGPIRNAYNVINNHKLPDFHFQNREMRLPVEREKNLLAKNPRQYDIVSNVYYKDHEERVRKEEDHDNKLVMQKYEQKHQYDPVFSQFYDKNKEELFQQERGIKQQEHGKDFDKRLPPSYLYRQAYIQDPTKPLPDSLQTLDERYRNAKQRYKLKYAIEDEYNRRNLEDEYKKQVVVTNKVHSGRVLEEKSKEFDIITTKKYPSHRAQDLYRKTVANPKPTNTFAQSETAMRIKSGGFN